jgi:hypothetical protein
MCSIRPTLSFARTACADSIRKWRGGWWRRRERRLRLRRGLAIRASHHLLEETRLRKSRRLQVSFASLLLLYFVDSAHCAQLEGIIGSNNHVHAEWTKHRNWVQGSTPMEDYLNNTADFKIRPDQSFSGTFDQSVKSWSQSFSVEGNFRNRTFRVGQGFFTSRESCFWDQIAS